MQKKQTADNLHSLLLSLLPVANNFSIQLASENALVIITDENSFSFNDCTIEKFLFQLSCTQEKKIPFRGYFLFCVALARRDCLSELFVVARFAFTFKFSPLRKIPLFPTSITTYLSFEYLPLKCTFAQRILLTQSLIGIALIFTLF